MRFLLPTPFEAFLDKYIKDPSQTPLISAQIKTTLSENPTLIKKQFGNKALYCLELKFGKYYHRVLFERTKVLEETFYKPCYFVWCHQYPTEVKTMPFMPSIEGFECISPHQPPVITSAPTPMTYFQGQWFEPTVQQSLILNHLQMPQLIVGPPGSGKTFLIMSLMQEQALRFLEENKSGVFKMLYFTESALLVKQMKKNWADWEKENLTLPTRILVHFTTRNDYATWYASSILNQPEALLSIDERLTQSMLPKGIPLETAKEELAHNAFILNQDYKKQMPFTHSRYKKLGQKQSLFDESTRALLFPLFCHLLNTIEQEARLIPGLSPLPLTDEADAFDLIFVDEAQKERPQMLMSLLNSAKASQILFFGDSLQNLQHRLCALPELPALCYEANKDKPLNTEMHLPSTLRLHPQVAKLSNALVLLYQTLRKGLADSLSYPSIASDETHAREEESMIYYFEHAEEDIFRKIGQNPKAAALILDEQDRSDAQSLTQGHHIFNSSEAGGLEFALTLLYLSSQTLERFAIVSQKMQEQGISASSELTPKHNLSPEKKTQDHDTYALLSALLITISRTSGQLWIYFPKPDPRLEHKIQHFLTWLLTQIGKPPKTAPTLTETQSTPDDWLAAVHRLLQAGLTEQAKGDLIDRLKLEPEQATRFIIDFEKGRAPSHLATLHAWLKPTEKPKPQSPPPTTTACASNRTP